MAKPVDLGPLPGYLGYALRRAQMMVFSDVFAALQDVSMSPGEFSVLIVAEHNPGIRPSDICTALAIQKANLVPVLAALEKRGLLDRRAALRDGRSLAIHTTPAGRRLLRRAQRLQARHEKSLTGRIGAQGRAELLLLLQRLMPSV